MNVQVILRSKDSKVDLPSMKWIFQDSKRGRQDQQEEREDRAAEGRNVQVRKVAGGLRWNGWVLLRLGVGLGFSISS